MVSASTRAHTLGNVPMSRINFGARHEYESLTNYKVLQNVFNKNRIDKPIPVDRLVRCKMQDNLEFLQWIKKFWDLNYTGEGLYDAEKRRAGQNGAPVVGSPTRRPPSGAAGLYPRSSMAPRPSAASRPSTAPRPSAVAPRPSAAAPRPSVAPAQTGPRRMSMAPRGVRGRSAAAVSNETIQQLTAEIDEMKLSVDSLERERDFYFGKLRDVEVILQERLGELIRPTDDGGEELADPNNASETETLKQIQGVLYQTEEGFELPDAVENEVRAYN